MDGFRKIIKWFLISKGHEKKYGIISDRLIIKTTKYPRPPGKTPKNDIEISSVHSSEEYNISPIFILNIDCMDEICEYLSLKDLHSFGQTCKAMHQATGEYFKRNYKSTDSFGSEKGIITVSLGHNERTLTTGFTKYITRITHDNKTILPLLYIELCTDNFTSLNHIYLANLMLNSVKVECIRRLLLTKVEILRIQNCTLDNDLYRVILKFCKNLKQLYVHEYIAETFDKHANSWMLRQYPMLEHFEFTPKWSFEMEELHGFLELNSTIRSFSTDLECLCQNKEDFMKSTVKLDKLGVKIFQQNNNVAFSQEHCDVLNVLFKQGFYKSLEIQICYVDQHCSDLLSSLHQLDVLCIRNFTQCFDLPRLTTLKELAIFDGTHKTEMDILARSLVNLRRVYLKNALFDDLGPFFRHSILLEKIMAHFRRDDTGDADAGDAVVTGVTNAEGVPSVESSSSARSASSSEEALIAESTSSAKSTLSAPVDLLKMNKEREQLKGAKKVSIFVPDDVFLTTKWARGNLNLRFVEMKRCGSIDWDYYF